MRPTISILLLLCFSLSVMSQDINLKKDKTVQLNSWEFRQSGSNKWYPATIPGTIHTDLLDNELIKDPFYRINEDDLQWIDKVNWEYKTTFELQPGLSHDNIISLVFEGLDTYAEVFLNGQLIHKNKNMFVKTAIPLDNKLLQQKNELIVYFKSPVMAGLSELEKYGLALPADNDQSQKGGLGDNRVSVFTRKAPYHYGWDWGPRLVTSGIWKEVYIVVANTCSIIDLSINQIKLEEKLASLNAEIELDVLKDTPLVIEILAEGKQVAKKEINGTELITKSPSKINIPFKIQNPLLWWPNGHGKQNLYNIEVKILAGTELIDEKSTTLGLRNIRLIRMPDKQGETFYFEVNEKPVFAKGANYIPNDVFLPRVSPEKYEFIISSAAKANMNMLRVWGGGIYESDLFYDLCDKYGIMVWQDFMFACAMYPGSTEFLEQVSIEAEQNIKRLRNHPCIALWCGNNEIEIAWAEYEENRGWGWKQRYSLQDRQKIWRAYDTIFHNILPGLVEMYSPQIPYWPSSPSAGKGKLASHANTSGDMHYWGVWHGNDPLEKFADYKARFMSEYGFQSFPEFESVKKFSEPTDWDINSEVMKSHQRSYIGNNRIIEYLAAYYDVPSQFEDLLYLGQILQAEAIKNAIESHRADMPYCMGSLYWQLNDCWPVASWSGIDYYGRWKALHYYARESFKPQIVRTEVKDGKIKIKGISDIKGRQVSLKVNLVDFQGLSIWNRNYQVHMPNNSSVTLTEIDLEKIPALKNSSSALLYVSLVSDSHLIDSDIFYFKRPKELKLPYPDIHIHIREKTDRYELEITSDKLCKNLMLISEGNSYSFSDNYFDLLPGETKVVTVFSTLPYLEFEKKLSYIHLQQVLNQ